MQRTDRALTEELVDCLLAIAVGHAVFEGHADRDAHLGRHLDPRKHHPFVVFQGANDKIGLIRCRAQRFAHEEITRRQSFMAPRGGFQSEFNTIPAAGYNSLTPKAISASFFIFLSRI